MKLKVVRPWRNLVPGRILEVADGYGNTLIRRQIAVAVQDESQTADVELAACQAKRKKRP